MSKITQPYPPLSGGVSQATERKLGMHQLRAQLNMIYDPVMGLTRREGTALLDSATSAFQASTHAKYRTLSYEDGATDVSVHYPAEAVAPGASPGLAVVNHTAGQLVPVDISAGAKTALIGGITAATAVGDLVVMAPLNVSPTYTVEYPWAEPANQRHHLLWVRGGAYSRTFRLGLVRGNQKLWVEYTTLEAAYPKVLDTSDLLPTDPDYLKKVNDRTNAYNSEATAWIAQALADITPENIALQLATLTRACGFLDAAATVTVVGTNVVISDPTIEEIEADDGGDGNLLRAVGNTVGAPELLSTVGLPGKVVRVRPGNSERGEVFYLKARAKDGSTGNYTPVTWEEDAGERILPDLGFLYGTLEAGTFYMRDSIAELNTAAGREYPDVKPNVAGDLVSNPPPEFFTSPVSALGTFQDRLVLCCPGGYVATSQPGDYLNFFRASAVLVLPTDPVTFFIIGAEGDTVRHFVSYDRNLILVGEKRQYAMNGRAALVPGAAAAPQFSSSAGMHTVRPAVVGDSLFFARNDSGFGSLHTLRPGRIAESPREVEISTEVNTFIDTPVEIAAMQVPSIAFLRTAGTQLVVADWAHGDGSEEYAIHEWDFPGAGDLYGVTVHEGYLRLLFQDGTGLRLEQHPFQFASRGSPVPVISDAGRPFTSRAVLVSPRFSPDKGGDWAQGLGANGFTPESLVVTGMTIAFADTGKARVLITSPFGTVDKTVQPKEV